MIDVYKSAIDATGRFGAVFERDGETAFFYLLDLRLTEGSQIVDVFNAHIVNEMPGDASVAIEWSPTCPAAGLYVGRDLVAMFDLRIDGQKGRWTVEEDKGLFARH